MKKLASGLIEKIHKENPGYTEPELIKMNYGIECFFYEFTRTLVLLIIFSLLSLTKEYLFVLVLLIALRPFTGGYHAGSNAVCYLISFVFLSIVIYVNKAVELELFVKEAILACSVVITALAAPVEHRSRAVRVEKMRRLYKILALLLTAAAGTAGFLLPSYYSGMTFLTLLFNSIMIAIGYFRYKKNNCQNSVPSSKSESPHFS